MQALCEVHVPPLLRYRHAAQQATQTQHGTRLTPGCAPPPRAQQWQKWKYMKDIKSGGSVWQMGATFGGWVLRVAERSPNASAVKEGWGYSEPWRVLVTGCGARRALPAIPPLDSQCFEADVLHQ